MKGKTDFSEAVVLMIFSGIIMLFSIRYITYRSKDKQFSQEKQIIRVEK